MENEKWVMAEIQPVIVPESFCMVHYFFAADLMASLMRRYVPHRQILPLMAASMSASVGFGFDFSNEAALIICPA